MTASVPADVRSLIETDFCVVDTETTGGSAAMNRIIEFAAYHVRDGIILGRYHTLLNPGMPIPPWITLLTGIDDEMVKNAPRFADAAPAIRSILAKGVFTAHNAGFDYGFVQEEFRRVGVRWEAEKVCTVRLARILFPELPSRSLGALCEHLLIDIADRHRAHGDAEATVYALKHMLKLAAREFGVATWADLLSLLQAGPVLLPPGLSPSVLQGLPESPGRYVFRDATGNPVFEGKCKNVRQRVRAYFRKANQSAKSKLYRSIVRTIEAAAL